MSRTVFVAVASIISLRATALHAEPLKIPPFDEDPRVAARTLAERGDAQFGAGRCDKAIPLWQRAEARYHAPTILLRIARCQSLLGRVVDAAATLEAIVLEPLAADAPFAFVLAHAEARRDLDPVRARVATLRLQVSTRGEPVGTSIEIDGAQMPPERSTFRLDPGPHLVRVRAERSTWERPILLGDGEVQTYDVTLAVEPRSPSARVQRRVGLALAGVGTVSVGVGVGFAMSALATARRLDQVCGPDRASCPPDARADVSQVRAHSIISDATLGGGAALAVTGAILLATEPRSEALRIRFAATPLSAAIAGEF